MVNDELPEVKGRKFSRLSGILSSVKSICIAYPEGVDSSFLIKIGKDILRENVLTITATPLTYPQHE